MRLIRLRLFAFALVVVTGQLGSGLATSMLLCHTSSTGSSTALSETACTCAHGPMAECPMHKSHKSAGSPTSDPASRESRWCSGCDDSSAILLTTLAFAGPVVNRHESVAPTSATERFITIPVDPLDVVLPLVSPPPRA